MSVLAAVGLGVLIGAVLGALGGAGAILTVPALVYLLGQSAHDATTGSLVIVGLTALVGAADHARSRRVHWRTGTTFGIAGIVAAFAGATLNSRVEEHLLLLGFSAIMLLAAAGMFLRTGSAPVPDQGRRCSRAVLSGKVVLTGLVVGFLTGFLGVGGGFIIVPVLVLVLGLPLSAAVGTSLVIIAINSAASLAAHAGQAHFDWALIVPFAIAAMLGSLAGKAIAAQLPDTVLNRAFALLLVALAACVITANVLALS